MTAANGLADSARGVVSGLVRWLPLLCGAVPVVVALVSYEISSSRAQVPECFVFGEGCTSISAAGRQFPASFLFKGAMLPIASLIAVYWLLAGDWLRTLGARPGTAATVRSIGVIGALFFVLYVTFLGSQGEVYQLMRRYGVTVYFSFTVLAQMFLARAMLRCAPDSLGRVARTKLGLCLVMLLMGLAITLPEVAMEVPDEAQNIVEWNFALLMHLNIALTTIAWLRTGVSTRLSTADHDAPDARQASLPR